MQDIEHLKNKVIQSALALAEMHNWADVTFHQIVRHCDCNEADIRAIFDDNDAIISAYGREVDLRVEEAFANLSQSGESEKDRLFDVLMERFDILNENREAVISIVNAVTLDPRQSILSPPSVFKSMTRMVGIANIKSEGVRETLKITALTALYIKILRDWVNDDSTDMAPTMASLDKALSYFDKL